MPGYITKNKRTSHDSSWTEKYGLSAPRGGLTNRKADMCQVTMRHDASRWTRVSSSLYRPARPRRVQIPSRTRIFFRVDVIPAFNTLKKKFKYHSSCKQLDSETLRRLPTVIRWGIWTEVHLNTRAKITWALHFGTPPTPSPTSSKDHPRISQRLLKICDLRARAILVAFEKLPPAYLFQTRRWI